MGQQTLTSQDKDEAAQKPKSANFPSMILGRGWGGGGGQV